MANFRARRLVTSLPSGVARMIQFTSTQPKKCAAITLSAVIGLLTNITCANAAFSNAVA